MLEEKDFLRYSRQIELEGFGVEGQEKLKQAKVLIVGVGGLGSIASLLLVASGVGVIGLIDKDKVSLTNLHRQILQLALTKQLLCHHSWKYQDTHNWIF